MRQEDYEDRGIIKWKGFYLSDHTAKLSALDQQRNRVILPKKKMTEQEINHVLTEARLKDKAIAIQLDVKKDNAFQDDVVGKVNGYDELGIFVGVEHVLYEEIRHVEIHVQKKWSSLD
ncbi:hypothetical protein [Enterococcus mediterraneensis]|uniref:hypothetical protein n=1 Tax=Enterococcus mediterraneensis TaxID=2364791 RepID=UPI000F066D04|nr:hypothetical protein [Enterococcus mediterraneensis]